MLRTSFISLSLVLGSAFVGACDSGGPGAVGAPCESADDCSGDLICDEHDGQASCQVEHGHGESESESESESDHEHESESDSHEDSEGHDTHEETHGEDTDGHEHETEGHEHETEGHETEGHGTDPQETEGSGSGSETSEGGDALCEAFCGCMAESCASFDGYPYADEVACMAACESWDAATLSCFGGFCEQAANSSPDLAEHQCEHAWGELGDEKC